MDYIQSIAITKLVNRNGKVTQHHSGKNIRNNIQATSDTIVYNQYFPKLFDSELIVLYFKRKSSLFITNNLLESYRKGSKTYTSVL